MRLNVRLLALALAAVALLLSACDTSGNAQKARLRVASQQSVNAAAGDSATTASGDTVVFRGVNDLPGGDFDNPLPVAVDVASDGRLRMTHEGDIFQNDEDERVTTMLQRTAEVQ
jgi:ABC-type oligopeptide transport system substrate-binding subunit